MLSMLARATEILASAWICVCVRERVCVCVVSVCVWVCVCVWVVSEWVSVRTMHVYACMWRSLTWHAPFGDQLREAKRVSSSDARITWIKLNRGKRRERKIGRHRKRERERERERERAKHRIKTPNSPHLDNVRHCRVDNSGLILPMPHQICNEKRSAHTVVLHISGLQCTLNKLEDIVFHVHILHKFAADCNAQAEKFPENWVWKKKK